MNVHLLCRPPAPELAGALEQFEKQFSYPLGPGQRFRISHGNDYPRFFRAIGDAASHVAECRRAVWGTIGAAHRRLLSPSGKVQSVVYLGDVKVAPAARAGTTLVHLARAVHDWGRSRADAAYSVVMDGTPVTPVRYTGRLGIPPFVELGKITILRLSTASFSPRYSSTSNFTAESTDAWATDAACGEACYLSHSAGRYASLGGTPAERSQIEPLWLMAPDGRACGRLEDTRRAKRLYVDDGSEILSAHLSCFAYQDATSAAEVLRRALAQSARRGFPALFISVAPADVEALCKEIGPGEVVTAPATVFGTGLEPGSLWNINTAEI